MRSNELSVRNMASAFETYNLYDYMIDVYIKGGKISHDDAYFSMELANVYLAKGDLADAVKYYLLNIEANPMGEQLVKNAIQNSKDEAKLLAEMETQLYSKVQKNSVNEDYIDMLTWIYVQNKDFEGALAQMKALDKRKGENGYRVLNIARMAQSESDYANAIAGYEYVVNKGRNSDLYYQARTELLNCRKEKLPKTLIPRMTI